MDATDDLKNPADPTVTQPDGATPALPAEPPPLDGAPTDLRPPAFQSVAPHGDVEVTLDTSNTVSVPPPPMPAVQPAPAPPPVDPAASHNGVMRVVRRRVRMVGVDESGNPNPSSIPTTTVSETTVTVPPAPLPVLPDLGIDFSDTLPRPFEEPRTQPDPAEASPERHTRVDAVPPPPARVVTPAPVAAIRVEESVPKRPSSPPPTRRPSNPPPPMPASTASATASPTAQAVQTAASSSPPLAAPTPPAPPIASTPPVPATTSAPPPQATASAPPVAASPVVAPPPPPMPSRPPPAAPPLTTITIPAGGPPPFSPASRSAAPAKPDAAKPVEAAPAKPEAAKPVEAAPAKPVETPPAPAADADDESVEVSLDEHSDSHVVISSSRPPRGIDPSLALLDELAELGHATPVESVDPDAIEHLEPSAARNASMPPPPPTDASRKGKGAGATKISGGPTLPDARPRRRRMWWEELFNEDYFRTVEKLTPQQVQSEADWIEHALGVEAGAAILDVGCGAGRQAIELSRRRYEVSAVDLSVAMLARASEAAQELGARVAFTQCDMAQMEFTEQFDAAYCVGSTFGFFDDPRNNEVARRIHRALKPHGTFLLAVLNRDHVIQHQPAMSWFEGEGCVCMEESTFNYITSRVNVKRTMIYDDGRQREFEYSVRLYSLHELGQVLHEAGFRILEVSGQARTPGAFFGPSSRELIILAQKRAPEVVELGDPNAADSTRPQ